MSDVKRRKHLDIEFASAQKGPEQASVLVLAIHGSPGDPQRARKEFAFLGSDSRPFEIVLLNDKENPVAAQLAAIARKHDGAELVVAPFLLGAGWHYQHDLLPALADFPAARLLPLFGRSAQFLNALHFALFEHSPPSSTRPLFWLVPGGELVSRELREQLELLRPDLAAKSIWYPLAKAELPPSFVAREDSIVLVAVLREGKISAKLAEDWPGDEKPRVLFTPAHLKQALESWSREPGLRQSKPTRTGSGRFAPALAGA